MTSKVPKGLATWAGIIAAAGQYCLAVALFLDTFDQADPVAGLGALATATATLWKVIEGRMRQAQTLARVDAAQAVRMAQVQSAASDLTRYAGVAGQRAYAGGEFRQDEDPAEGDTTGCQETD